MRPRQSEPWVLVSPDGAEHTTRDPGLYYQLVGQGYTDETASRDSALFSLTPDSTAVINGIADEIAEQYVRPDGLTETATDATDDD